MCFVPAEMNGIDFQNAVKGYSSQPETFIGVKCDFAFVSCSPSRASNLLIQNAVHNTVRVLFMLPSMIRWRYFNEEGMSRNSRNV